MRIRNKIFILIILVFLMSWVDEFKKTENIFYVLIVGIIIIVIYLYLGIYTIRKLAKYRTINKILLRDGIIAGLILV